MRLVVGAGRLLAEQPEDELGRALEQPDQRPEHGEEHPHRSRNRERDPLGVTERDSLRHQLADHHVQEGDDQEREGNSQDARHHGVEAVGEHLLAECADCQARDRDAELHRRDEARRVARDLQDGARAAVALAAELPDPRPPRGDEAVLGCHEKRVEEDQARKSQELEKKGHPSVARARSLAERAGHRTYVLSSLEWESSTARSRARLR